MLMSLRIILKFISMNRVTYMLYTCDSEKEKLAGFCESGNGI